MKALKRSFFVYILLFFLTCILFVSSSYSGFLDDISNAVKKQTSEQNAKQTDEWIKKADAYWKEGNFKDAANAYSKAIELNPQDSRVYIMRGNCNNILKNYQPAILDFTKAIEISPNNTKILEAAYDGRGYANALLGNSDPSMRDYDKVTELNPKDASAYYARACLYSLNNNVTEACRELKNSIDLGYNNWKHIKTDSDMNNIRNAPCYKEIMAASEIPPFTFLNIGENDTYSSVLSKMSDDFVQESKREIELNYPTMLGGYDFEKIDPNNEFRKVAKNYYKYWQNIGGAESVINKYGKSMIWVTFDPKQGNSIITRINFYFSKRNDKLLYYHVYFKDGTISDISKRYTEKYGRELCNIEFEGGRRSSNPFDTSQRASGVGLYYWEDKNDCLFVGSNTILYKQRGPTFLVAVYGSNFDEFISTIKQIHESKIKEDANSKSAEVNKF